MSRLSILAVILACAPATVLAQEEMERQPVRIVITKLDCSRLIRHVPAADVAYQPGMDAKGRAVAPADIPGSGADAIPNLVPDVIEFPLLVNPLSYGARNKAQKDKASAAQGLADTHAGKNAAQTQIDTLNKEKTALNAKSATLSAQKAALDANKASATATLNTYQAQVDAGTRAPSDRDYLRAKWAVEDQQKLVAAKQAEINSNTASLNATNSAIAAQQAIVDGAPAKNASYSAAQSAADAKLAQLSSRGLDNTTMNVGTVRYDMARGIFTFNGEPLGGAEQQELARLCQKQGVR
ncbi:MAG: hypothetical protein ACM3Q1_09820 [Bacteroidales bacterium]